jgi:hypothetical protein
VIVAPILPGFSFGMFGTPEESANGLLDKTIAPPGSEKKASLISAKEEVGDGELYFTMEYTGTHRCTSDACKHQVDCNFDAASAGCLLVDPSP